MKKVFTAVIIVATVLLLSGCQKDDKDSPSTAVAAAEAVSYYGELAPDDHGWLVFVEFTKKGDDVTEATFDCLLVDKKGYYEEGSPVQAGDLKTEMSKNGLYNMKVAGAVLDWHEQIALVEEYFVENDGFSGINFDEEGHDIDGVTGASIHISEFKEAVEAAKPVDSAARTFAFEAPMDDHGWQNFVVYTVKGDDVISATMDCFLADPSGYLEDGMDVEMGDLKTDLSKEGIYNMKVAGAKADWHEQIASVEDYFVANDSLKGIKLDEEGHDVDGVTGASIHISEFIELVEM